MENEISIKDESGDRKYFTQLPHCILNHSTANDQALYCQMKRYAGETGKCFATQRTLMKKLGIGKQAFDKSVKYLLDKKWIRFVGITEGKTKPIKTYAIVDIWKLNIMEYEKISSEIDISSNREITSKTAGDNFQNRHKITSRTDIEEEPSKEEPIKKNTISNEIVKKSLLKGRISFGNPDINEVLVFLKEELGGSLDGTVKDNRRFAFLLLNRFKKDYPAQNPVDLIKFLIVNGRKDNFHAKNITSFKYLFYNSQKIIQLSKLKKSESKLITI